MKVLFMGLEMLRKIVNPFRQKSDLDNGRAGVLGVYLEILDDLRFLGLN